MKIETFIRRIISDQKGLLSNSWLCFTGGLIFIGFGIWMFFTGGYFHWGVYVPVAKLTAIAMIVYGAFTLRAGYRGISKKAEQEFKYFKCPDCGHVCFAHEAPDRKCPKCSGAVENLDGFFDRHPELRDKEIEKK